LISKEFQKKKKIENKKSKTRSFFTLLPFSTILLSSIFADLSTTIVFSGAKYSASYNLKTK